ncbi:MAG: hypothetical protein CL477_12550 [Acidobacteria bacterium]|jgi:hypothetical protein|nr:hypothetical protein [Acidobacteriota bacterium]|tara:strand:+ start:2277 stop:2765 length:489 start_codon:yes stop_codon:yes gene_type:complete
MNVSVTTTNLLEQFARTLMTSLDGSRDGQLSTTEFTSFLSKFAGEGFGTDGHSSPSLNEGPVPELAGFNPSRLAEPSHTTVKYLFGRVAQRYSLESVHDKTSAESLQQQMQRDLKAAGLNVLNVSQDKIQIQHNDGQTSWFDIIRDATAGSPAFQWLDTGIA